MALDKDQIGTIGKHLLITNLFAAGFEVAEPILDRGIDLIAFHDGKSGERFDAWPIQVKSSSGKSFVLDKKYKKLPRLVIVYVWNATIPEKAEFFAVTYGEALEVLKKRKHTKRSSWKEGGRWVATKVGTKLETLLEPYKVTAEGWKRKLLAVR